MWLLFCCEYCKSRWDNVLKILETARARRFRWIVTQHSHSCCCLHGRGPPHREHLCNPFHKLMACVVTGGVRGEFAQTYFQGDTFAHVFCILFVKLILLLVFFYHQLKELSSSLILQPWCVWTYWPMPWNASTTPRSAVSVRCCCVPAQRWSSSSWLWWWSTDTLASSRSLTIIALARLLSTLPDVWTNAALSRHALMCPSTILRSGPTICCPLVSSAMSFWPHPAALWITRRPGENIWEAKSLVSSSKMEIIK